MYQRIFGIVLLLCCLGLAATAWGYHAPFSYEPVGPRAYPLLLLMLMGLGAIYLIAKPASATAEHDEPPLDRHVLSKVPYQDMTPPPIDIPPRPQQGDYKRPPFNEQFFVPNNYPYKD